MKGVAGPMEVRRRVVPSKGLPSGRPKGFATQNGVRVHDRTRVVAVAIDAIGREREEHALRALGRGARKRQCEFLIASSSATLFSAAESDGRLSEPYGAICIQIDGREFPSDAAGLAAKWTADVDAEAFSCSHLRKDVRHGSTREDDPRRAASRRERLIRRHRLLHGCRKSRERRRSLEFRETRSSGVSWRIHGTTRDDRGVVGRYVRDDKCVVFASIRFEQ